MPTKESWTHGTPSWVDLSTSDVEGARAFYGALFGWDFTENPAGDRGTYTMATQKGKSAAGIMQQVPEQAEMGVPPMWNTYVTVDDIDASTATASEAGGSVMMPAMDVMDSGRMAVVVDPTGAVVCLWQPLEHIGCEIVNEHGALTWNECTTPDLDAASAFYKEMFGWDAAVQEMPTGPYTVFSLGEDMIAGGLNPQMEGVPPHWGTMFAVDDCQRAIDTAVSSGGSLVNGPFDIGIGVFAVLTDPQGAFFQVMQATPQDE